MSNEKYASFIPIFDDLIEQLYDENTDGIKITLYKNGKASKKNIVWTRENNCDPRLFDDMRDSIVKQLEWQIKLCKFKSK